MKKVLSVVLTLALVAALSVMPASAAMSDALLGNQAFTSLVSFDESVVKTGLMVQDDITWASFNDHNYDVTIVANGGESGQAYSWISPAGTANLSFGGVTVWFDELGVSGDLSGKTDLVFWIDTSAATADMQAGLQLIFADGEDKTMAYQTTGLDVEIVENGAWKKYTPSYTGWGRTSIPVGYKGWIKLSLDATNWKVADMNANSTVKFDLAKVIGVFVGVDCKSANLGKTIVVDSIGVLGEKKAEPTTTEKKDDTTTTAKKDDTTTTAKKDDTTTAAGATTGEAAPIAAAVALVLAGGAVVALRKRSK